MKATRVLLVLASVFAAASGALRESISGKNPVIHGDEFTWPLAFQFNGSGPTIFPPTVLTIRTDGAC